MSKTITIKKENKEAIKVVKIIQEEKKRLKDHVSKGGKLDDFKFNITLK